MGAIFDDPPAGEALALGVLVASDGDEVHVFFLQAPRALGDPDLRHHHATIGHAVSHDLRDWRVLPDALGPGAPGDFDDLATWITARANYGPSDARGVIGHVKSPDLHSWEIGPPLCEPGELHKLEVPQLVHLGGSWRTSSARKLTATTRRVFNARASSRSAVRTA